MNRKFFAYIFFLSGACGLIYEILWTRLYAWILGNTYLAISMIVAAFMGGLFSGAYVIGRLISKSKNELQWYAFIELIIGGYALFLLLLFGPAESAFKGIYALLGKIELLYNLGNFLAIFLLILIPTTAMGATLPLAVEYFTKNKNPFGDNISVLYALNTAGGATGTLVAGFFLIESLGVRASLVLTAGINIAIGVTVLLALQRHPTPNQSSLAPENKPAKAFRSKARKQSLPKAKESIHLNPGLCLLAAGLSGFTALAYEIVWTRGLKFLIHNSTYSFSVVLFVFLAGIALGSGIAKKLISKGISLSTLFGRLQIALGLYAIFTIYLLYGFSYSDFFQANVVEIVYDYSYSWIWGIAIYTLTCALMFLLPTMIMGISFPLLNEFFFAAETRRAGKTVSSIYAVNTIGSIAGSLGAGAILIPAFGIKTSLFIIATLNLLLGAIFVVTTKRRIFPTFGIAAALLAVMISLSADGKYLFGRKEKKADRVLYYKEGLMSTVKVYERNADRFMSIDGVSIASTDKVLLKKERLIAHLPFFLKLDIKTALAVGLASGISAGSMTLHPNLERLDCVELIKAVFPAAAYFSKYNGDLFNNPKVRLIYDDVYAYLKYNPAQYDLISSDGKLDPLHSANTIMLSTDYYELCKTRMKPDGLFIQWLPITTPHQELQVILDTLKKSFKHVALFFFYPTDFYMLATDVPIILDKAYMDQVFATAPIQQELAAFNVQDATAIFSSFIGTYESAPANHIRLNSFNQPILEFEFMREWKKSRQWTGGFRAKNLRYLTENYEKANFDSLLAMTKNIEPLALVNTFKASRLFFKGAVQYFETGNPVTSFQDYRKFQTDITDTN